MLKTSTKKGIVAILILALVITMLPIGDLSAYAFDGSKYYVDNITITKIYNDGGYAVSQTKVTIRGRYLQNVSVGTMTSTGYKVLKNADPNMETVQEFLVAGDIVGETIDVGNVTIPIIQNELPTLLSIDKRSVRIGSDDLTLNGSYLSKISLDPDDSMGSPAEYSAYYENQSGAGGQIDLLSSLFTGNTVIIPKENLHGVAGLQNIILKKEKTEQVDFENENGVKDVKITIQNTYVKQFRLVDKISIDNLVMNPNRGQPGETISIMATNGLDNYDIFFLKNLSDKFSVDNKGRSTSFTPNIDNKQVLTTQVPPFKLGAIENGEYYVVLTNKVPEGKNPNDEVNKQLIVGLPPNYEKFTVIDSEQKIKIFSAQPNRGPDTGSKVEISGLFFGSLNIPDFLPNDDTKTVTVVPNTNETVLQISYSTGTYKGFTVESATRTVKIVIGSLTKFAKRPNDTAYEHTFTNGLDKISVITPSISDAETNPIKDIVVETETTFDLEEFPNNIIVKDRAELKNGYTFIPSKVSPTVTDITPPKIQVSKVDNTDYRINEDRMVAIYGTNFLVHKYVDNDGEEVIRYPIVELGRDIVLNKNSGTDDRDSNPDLYFKVFDKNGKEVDGTEGNELGEKILVIIPEDSSISGIGKTYVKVINPVRNAESEGISHQKYDAVEFINIVDLPVIESVDPNIVTVDGNKDITVTGNNFQEGAKVYLDGKEVPGITRDLNNQANKMLLKFKVPPGREGTTQLQVMNPDGGIAVAEFTYVKTFNKDPEITTFSPNKGSSGILVVMNGGNFLKSDPTTPSTSGLGIYRLIGSRIKLGDNDINSYVKSGGVIVLKNYVAPQAENSKLVYKDMNNVKAADYYHSVVMEDDITGKYYTLDVDSRGIITLSDGVSNTFTITRPLEEQNSFEALKGGLVYTASFIPGDMDTDVPDKIKLNNGSVEIFISVKTPYTTETKTIDSVTGSYITGNRVKVINKSQLIFTVPQLEVEKWYDVTIVNPDTKSSTKAGQQGFYYFKQPVKKPTIESISPSQGSIDGGYTAIITGTNFKDDGTDKSEVIIGGVKVLPADITVSTDGTQLSFIVPKYPGDLQDEVDTDRKMVPLVVKNSDGGHASKEDGFTYIIPISHPKINKLLPDRGTAAGGSTVQIFGSDFRYFEPYRDANANGYDLGDEFENINNNTKWDDLEGKAMSDLTEEDIKILPKIYFGKSQARILEFADGYLVVETPAGAKGLTDVYVVNNDYGISNKFKYTYEASSPIINSVMPKEGKKQGKDKIEINGNDFVKNKVNIYNDQTDDSGNTKFDTREMALVRFGDTKNTNISNREIPVDQNNGGRIVNKMAKVNIRDLIVDYNAEQKTLTFTIKNVDQGKEYKRVINGYDDSTKYVLLSSLKDGTSTYNAYEMVQVAVDGYTRKLQVERGYAPYDTKATIKSTQLVLYTPTYYAIGTVPVTVINPDGGQGKTEFEYKNPDSSPRITNITKEGRPPMELDGERILELTYKGGNIVSILGDDFRSNARIQISDVVTITPEKIEYDSLPTKLTFTMPAVAEGAVGELHRVMVINDDGGVASSDESLPTPLYIRFVKGETSPAIEKILPEKGPASGGTRVTIYGKDFRKEIDGKKLTVYFGDVEVPEKDLTVVDYQTIVVYTPSQKPGKVSVKVENPDGELSVPKAEYTYLSTPNLIAVVDPNDPEENTRINAISVEGGQTIKLKGSNFMEGARVIFAPTLTALNEGANPNGELVYVNGKPNDLQGGSGGTEVTYINDSTITVKTPQGKLDMTGIIVVNPDGGASSIYEDVKYGLPEISAPAGVTAELLYDRYIKINWAGVAGAKDYEIHVVINNRTRELIGTTELNSFVYQDLTPNTKYRFIVKAVGDFGASKPSNESNTIETGRRVGPPDTDGELGEEYREEKVGSLAKITIGAGAFDGKDLTIDLTKGTLAGSKEVIVSIPASVIADSSTRNIIIIGSDLRVKLHPNAFYTDKVKDNKSKNDAGVRFQISPDNSILASSGQTILSTGYIMKASMYLGKDSTDLDYLRSSIQITMDVDQVKADMRKLKTIYMGRYDGYEGTWINVAGGNSDSFAISGLVDRLGQFAIIGSRR